MTPWGLARVEVIASKEHIASELQRGVPVKQIHDALVSAGRVSVTYNSFRRQIQHIRDEIRMLPIGGGLPPPRTKSNTPARKDTPDTSTTTSTSQKASGGFVFDPTVKADDYF